MPIQYCWANNFSALYYCVCVCGAWVLSYAYSLQPHELKPIRLLCYGIFQEHRSGLPFPSPGDLLNQSPED